MRRAFLIAGGPDRVAPVVQAVEHRHEVITAAAVRRRGLDSEANSVGRAGLLGSPTSGFDRTVVVVEPTKVEFGYRPSLSPIMTSGAFRGGLRLTSSTARKYALLELVAVDLDGLLD